MAKQRWKISVTIESDADGTIGDREEVSIEKRSHWESGQGSRDVNECIAIDMAYLSKMLMESGNLISQSSLAETADAFHDVCCNP